MAESRRAWVKVEYNERDITEAVSSSVISLSYTDNSSDEADELQLHCHDRENKWIGPWYPKLRVEGDDGGRELSGEGWSFADSTGAFGDINYVPAPPSNAIPGTILKAKICVENWNSEGDYFELDCGAFEIDGVDFSGPPDAVSIKSISTPLSSSMRRVEKSRAWEDTTLRQIAQDVSDGAGMELMYEVESDIQFDRVDQLQQSDMAFLQELARRYGVSVKVTSDMVVLFEESVYERRAVVDTFDKQEVGIRINDFSFSQDTTDSVCKAECSYKDPKSGELARAEFVPDNPPATRQVALVNYRPGDLRGDNFREGIDTAEGESGGTFETGFSPFNETAGDFDDIRADATDNMIIQARAACREKNKKEWTCTLKLVGNVNMVSGATIQINGFGVYSGKYLITKARHKVGNWYTTDITAHRVLGY